MRIICFLVMKVGVIKTTPRAMARARPAVHIRLPQDIGRRIAGNTGRETIFPYRDQNTDPKMEPRKSPQEDTREQNQAMPGKDATSLRKAKAEKEGKLLDPEGQQGSTLHGGRVPG